MDHASHIARRLHGEHLASLALLSRFEAALAARQAPAPGDRAWGEIARAVCAAFEDEVAHHFEFEERELFPRLANAGEPGIGALLAEEHRTIRAVAADLLPALRATIAGTPPDWQVLRNAGFGFAERMQGHIQKEEMGLLPMIEDLIDARTDEALAMAYAACEERDERCCGYHGKGVGHALLSQFFVNLAALHIERVETVVAHGHAELMAFFRGAGFAQGQRLAFHKSP